MSDKKCPFCGETIKEEAIVCRYCGRNIANIHTPQQARRDEFRRSPGGIIIGIILLIFFSFLLIKGCTGM